MKQARLAAKLIVLGSCFLSTSFLSSCIPIFNDAPIQDASIQNKAPKDHVINGTNTKTGSADPLTIKDSVKTEQSKQVKGNELSQSGLEQSYGDLEGEKITSSYSKLGETELLNMKGLPTVTAHSTQIEGLFSVQNQAGLLEQLITVDSSGIIIGWDLRSSITRAYQILKIDTGFTSIAFHRGTLNLAVSYPGLVEVYNLNAKRRDYVLNRVKSRISSMDFDPSGQILLLGGTDGVIYSWSFKKEQENISLREKEKVLERYFGHASVVNAIQYHPFGRVFFSADWYGGISAWLTYQSDRHGGKFDQNIFEGREFSEESNRIKGDRRVTTIVEHMVISKDGEFIFLAAEDGKLELWQVRGFKLVAEIQAHKGTIYSIALSPDGKQIVTNGRDGKLKLWTVDEQPGLTANTKIYSFLLAKELELSGFRQIVLKTNSLVLAGGTNGKLLQINLENGANQ